MEEFLKTGIRVHDEILNISNNSDLCLFTPIDMLIPYPRLFNYQNNTIVSTFV